MQALKEVSLSLGAGEIVAVIGENGAGKSTLLKILCGDYEADSGEVFCEGSPRRFLGIHDAMQQGIARIPQELELCESMTVAENLLLGREPIRSWGVIDEELARLRNRMNDLTQKIIPEFENKTQVLFSQIMPLEKGCTEREMLEKDFTHASNELKLRSNELISLRQQIEHPETEKSLRR